MMNSEKSWLLGGDKKTSSLSPTFTASRCYHPRAKAKADIEGYTKGVSSINFKEGEETLKEDLTNPKRRKRRKKEKEEEDRVSRV